LNGRDDVLRFQVRVVGQNRVATGIRDQHVKDVADSRSQVPSRQHGKCAAGLRLRECGDELDDFR
jgi:hypothetical protein